MHWCRVFWTDPIFLPVQMVNRLFFILLFTLIGREAIAQEEQQGRRGSMIVNDSTKQIYGPTTSRYFYEEDVFYNHEQFYYIDTLIHNFHRFTYVQKNDYLYQDLGNIGTASRSIHYQVPTYIGVNPGFEVYDLYWEGNKIRYFDTKSPYSSLRLNLGARGRSMTNVTFSRNINPRWNFGFDYRGLFIDKQVQRSGKGDRNVRSNYYDMFTTYHSKDSTYRLFFNFARGNHQVDEYGGVLHDEEYDYADFFETNIRPTLTEASTRELRINIHLFHQYKVGSGLQLYHTLDRYRQGNDFRDLPNSEPPGYYDYTDPEIENDTTSDRSKFIALRNEVGVKGNLLKLFYNGYYAIRNYKMDYRYVQEDTLRVKANGVESYLGGRMALQLDSLMQLRAWVEVMDNGNFRIEGMLKSKWLEASLKQNKYQPGFLHQAYRGSHDFWNNNFSPTDVTQLNGYIHFRSKVLNLSPGVTFTRLNNYVFFDQDTSRLQQVFPRQSAGSQVIFSPELRMSLTFFKHVTLRGQAIYTSLLDNADNAMSIPELFVNGQLAYENIHFGGSLELHTGVEVHWQSGYDPLNYDPVIQQFYIQDPRIAFYSPAFPIVDVFVNAKIKRGRIFLKYNNLVQAFTKEGYFPTPFYPGQANVIDFGFDWSFYD